MIDVVIMGAGPAGLTLGTYLARAGVPTLVLEKALHPRAHVGESLMPATVRIMREIGFHPLVEAGHFPRSGGVVYHAGEGRLRLSYAEFPQEGVEQPHTYHVDRAKFDMLLMKHAEASGCRLSQGVSARRVLFDEHGRARGVRALLGDVEVDIPARVVVDAAGRATLLGRQLDLRVAHPVLDRFALHAWFQGWDRGPGETASYTHIHLLPAVDGWGWQAPIDDSITSVGIVANKVAYHQSGREPETFMDATIAGSPSLGSAGRHARRINEIRGDVNYSYALRQVCGDGWLAIGDAALFVDPVFSSGVSAAMGSARVASGRIQEALESGSTDRADFLPYEQDLFRRAGVMDRLAQRFYQRPTALFELARSEEHRLGLLRLLQGDTPPEADRTLKALGLLVERGGTSS